ncbi:MAG: imidazolonepropionase [Candidatus Brocadiales bacterium]
MVDPADIVLMNASEVLTLGGASFAPKTGAQMDDLGIIHNGALAIKEGNIIDIGPTDEIEKRYVVDALERFDVSGKVVMPGFVDPHTHAVFGGTRVEEFELRLKGKGYLDILKEGGGILNTVSATRKLPLAGLVHQCEPHLDNMLLHGTTTAEIKSGYGLSLDEELKILGAIERLDEKHPLDAVSTFLGAHAVPEEFKDNENGHAKYVEEVLAMLPRVKGKSRAKFCDVFCDEGAFSLEDSRAILTKAKKLGFGIKIHACEFKDLGGTFLAVELGATSVDHLDHASEDGIKALAKNGITGVLLPGVPFFIGQKNQVQARQMIELGLPIALGTDFNPGSCPTVSMQMILSLACLEMGLTPEQAICASTINAAHALGLGQHVGSIEPAKKADVIVMNIPSYKYLPYQFGINHVDVVIKSGRIVVENKQIIQK